MDALADATEFVRVIENRQGIKISAIEEIAYKNGWISKESLLKMAAGYKTDYGRYLEYIGNLTEQ